ncbi:ABC transporter substrate-binding protein [Homoserinimonas sp. A447]
MHLRKVAAVTAVLALTLTACSSSDTPSEPASGEITIGVSSGISILDPSTSANSTDLTIFEQVYDTLLTADPETGELLPSLALGYELVEPTVWEFALREGVVFQDGSPFTAHDVKYSIERIQDPELNSTHASSVALITEVIIVDDFTVQIRTAEPDPVLPRHMQSSGGSGRVFIVPQEYFETRTQDEISDQPIGSGAYKVEEWKKGESITLVRNEDYWGEAAEVEKATFQFIPENSTRVNALLNGDVDVIDNVPVADMDRVGSNDGTQAVRADGGLVHMIALDSRTAPFNDIEARKAFAHSFDLDEILDSLLGDAATRLALPIAPTVEQYNDSLDPYTYDRDEAEKMLAGQTISLDTLTSNGRYLADADIYAAINAQISEVGFNVTPQSMEWGSLIGKMVSGEGGPFFIIAMDYGEGDASKFDSGVRPLQSIVLDDTYEAMFQESRSETDPAARTALWNEIQQYVYDQYLIAGAWQTDALFGASSSIDWVPTNGSTIDLSDIKLATD